MTKRNIIVLVLALFFLGVIFSFFYYRRPAGDLVEAKLGDVTEAVYGLGRVKSNRVYEFKLGVTGGLSELYVREGDKVKRASKILKLDDDSVVSSPFEGTVTVLPFHEKENIFPQAIVARIEDLGDLFVEVSLEQLGALRIRSGQSARLTLESLRGAAVGGSVESIFPKDDQFVVRIKSQKLPSEVLPGMTADVAIEVGSKKDVILLPLSGLSNGKVTIVRDGRRQKINVKVGVIDGNWAELVEGEIKPGDQILVPRTGS
ncbi:MAG: HlyD family efflux transporter periplasmic adaptor subunit [Bdellovibrionia bacterium]